jgi:hypothetical protein
MCSNHKPKPKRQQAQNGKGDKRRQGENLKRYRENYDRIFGKKEKK